VAVDAMLFDQVHPITHPALPCRILGWHVTAHL
jgi:hypothetical protein